jgi:release factor glutamine methyltransferase
MKYIDLFNECKTYNKENEAFLYLFTEIAEMSRSQLYLNFNQEIDEDIYIKLRIAINQYVKDNKPVQYIIGYTYFYGLKMMVNPKVLIPRFETEEVVEKAIQIGRSFTNPRIVDIGTGSGCIGITLKKHLPKASVMAIDISCDALEVAKTNANKNDVKIEFKENDLLSGISDKFDMIISNPPYIDEDEEVMDLVYDNEPHLALFSKNHGLYHYETILRQSTSVLNKNGVIIFEIAYNKKDEMIELANKYYKNIEVFKDIHNNDRIMIIQGEKK